MAWGPKGSLLPGKEKEDRDPLALKTAYVLAVTTRACAVALCVKCPPKFTCQRLVLQAGDAGRQGLRE